MLHSPIRDEELAETLRKSSVLSALECLMKYETDGDLRFHVRRRYLELSDTTNVTKLEVKS